jgi:DNA replication ATP-dependent helicase Dna2
MNTIKIKQKRYTPLRNHYSYTFVNVSDQVVVVEQEKSTTILYVILRQAWYETQCTSGSYVHIFGKFDSSNRCIVDNARNMIILHPDHLVSATVVADSFGCIRRAVLQDRVKATGSASAPMLYGNILHELCQEALKINRWDMKKLNEILEGILPRHYETMVEIGLTLKQAHEFLSPKMLEMGAWAAKFVRSLPARDATISSRGGSTARMSINKLLDVEEHVWSPNYGLKGNIDATVQVTIEDNGKHRTLTVPFEIKTGKRASEAHQAQTALYTLLISDRYDIDVTDGILYYLESSKTVQVKAIRHELIHMIMKRNELACYIRERRQLPPMLESNRQRLCNGCYAQTTCHLYHKLSEDGNGTLIERKDQFKSLVAHLKPIHSSFFKKWDFLITKEESEMMKFRRELWTMISSEREKVNRCFSNVIIMPGSKSEDNSTISKINRFQYTFVKQNPKPGFSFTESQLTTGEPIVVSDERGHFALANGYVTTVHRHSIIVAVDRRLHNARKRKSGFCSQNNQTFGGIMEVNPAPQTQSSEDDEPILYRLDKDEFSNGMATVRNNMLQIMDNSIFKAADLRSMVIEEREPVFRDCMSGWRMPSQASVGEMNSDQKTAVEKVMTAKDYALVLGMPGTGKTTTIAQIIRSLVAKGKTVLLTSYTHTAVDNILIKLRLAGIDVLRLGVISKIHPEVREFAVLGAEQRDSLEEVHATWHKPQVVATTCLGINHPLFSQRTFDYCIVDEASQITLPVCLGPIRMAKTFILVGDHYQLPPIVQNREALEGGLDMSLFRLLCEKHPQAVVSLEHQYRMCDDIMSIANKLIYSGRLKCGNNAIATRTLELPKTSEALAIPHSSALIPQPSASSGPVYICPSASYATCWLSPLLNPKNRVIFLNTDNLGQLGEEVSRGNRTTNPIEAILITQMTTLLINAGLSSSDLGIVTFYRSQLALLRQSLRHYSSLELHTADKFQGRDKEAVIVSFVRNNSDGNVGELLQDWRRINVAVTRARSKLILVGSAKTLAAGPEVLKGLVELCREKEWIYDLPEGAVDMHVAPDRGLWTQSPVAKSQKKRSLDASIDLTSPTTKKSLPRGALYGTDPNKVQCQHINGGMKKPARVGTISERVLASKPLFRDIMHDILGDNLT